jgi:hypothetical protein
MALEKYFLVTDGSAWSLKKEGESMPFVTGPGKDEQTKRAIAYINENGGGSLRIQKEDGTFEEERTYPRSDDPPKTKG